MRTIRLRELNEQLSLIDSDELKAKIFDRYILIAMYNTAKDQNVEVDEIDNIVNDSLDSAFSEFKQNDYENIIQYVETTIINVLKRE